MGAFHLFEDGSLALKEILSDMPLQVRTMMTRGFGALGSLTKDQLDLLSKRIAENVSTAADIDVATLAKGLGIPQDSAAAIVSAATLLVALITTRNEPAQDVINELVDAGLVSSDGTAAAVQLAALLDRDREGLKRSVQLGSLATQTLPSFRSLFTSIDLRLGFKAGSVELVVPTVVAHLVTDDNGSDSFFQLSKADVAKLIEQLSRIAADIEAAEAWSTGAR